ncbi:hypothetical protein OS493_010440 [Desmophyllum pertusum]|uniref:Protein kinase domain-containing protein n=1 Tax=Desmophyllum pertusum TaxID=174260 RepID=A0A9X0A4A3_9CNID|nr:hypothetical protein OS493_010440 [Desmophyllum pertusum]
MDDIVNTYLPEAFAFIYVINSANAGGIQRDRLEKLLEHARKVSLEQQREFSPTRALFVCNKWDQVPSDEAEEVKNYIIKKLTLCWPSVDPVSQIICMSSTNASIAQALGIITEEFAALVKGIKSMVLKSIEASLQIQWRWLYYLLSRMAYLTKAFIRNSSKDRKRVTERMMLITERLLIIEKQQSSVNKELQEYLESKTDNAVSALAKYLKSSDVVKRFTSWTLDDVPNAEESGESWAVTKNYIQKALIKRLRYEIARWEEENHVFADCRTSLIQYFQQRFNFAEGQLRILESSVIADNAASPAGGPLVLGNFNVAERVVIGVTSPIWVPVGLVSLIVSAPVIGMMTFLKKQQDWSQKREYKKAKCGFMAKASKEYLSEAAEKQHLRSYVVEHLEESQVCLRQVVARIPELIEAEKMLCQQLRGEIRVHKEIEDFYEPLCEMSLRRRDSMAMFGIKKVGIVDISCDDLEWKDDGSSLLGTGAFASVYEGRLKLREGKQPVALKVWKDELNDSNASSFLAETETLRKLNYPFIVKFYGAALLKEGDQVRGILVMELCKENLRRHIFLNPENIPGVSTNAATKTNAIRWARNIANALEFIHERGIVHRGLRLENILLSPEDVVKVADVGVARFAVVHAYVAPEVIRFSIYDSKVDIYSFGIMMWEMWYGKRALLEIGGDLNTILHKVAEGTRPSHVEDRRKPPIGWQHLMQRCWMEKQKNDQLLKCVTSS